MTEINTEATEGTMFSHEFLSKFAAAVDAAISGLAPGQILTSPVAARIGCEAAGVKPEIDEDPEWAALARLVFSVGGLPFTLVRGPFGGVKRAGWTSQKSLKAAAPKGKPGRKPKASAPNPASAGPSCSLPGGGSVCG